MSMASIGCHRFLFRPQENGIGQSWHLPVVVYRGEQTAMRLRS